VSFDWGGHEDGWRNRLDDEYDRMAQLRAAADATALARGWRQDLQASAEPDYRHTGTDKGLHHWSQIINTPGFAPDDSSDDPLDILGRQAVDQITAYEQQKARFAEQEAAEVRSWLESQRVRFSPRWEE